MDMSVSATGSSALREYQKSAGDGAGVASTMAVQQTLTAPTEGKHVNSLPRFHKLSNEEQEALASANPNFTRESLDLNEMNKKFAAMTREMLAVQEHHDFEMKRLQEQDQMMQEFFGKMGKELGGAQTAMAIPNNPLDPDPVRTSSGGIHPQSDRIKDYIRAHLDEWNSLSSPIPSFKEWQQARG